MKVVCCKNCGAKYQLDDDDDITTFECSSCAGDLEYLEDEYSESENDSRSSFIDSFKYDNSYIVQCEDCGLKYKIKSSDSILDYECDSCGGSLRYLDDDMNKELDNYLQERQKEAERKIAKQEAQIKVRDEYIQELKATNRTLCSQISSLFSYHRNHV